MRFCLGFLDFGNRFFCQIVNRKENIMEFESVLVIFAFSFLFNVAFAESKNVPTDEALNRHYRKLI